VRMVTWYHIGLNGLTQANAFVEDAETREKWAQI